MSITKLPSGRFRAQCYDPSVRRKVTVAKILDLPDPTFVGKREAKAAVAKAREVLASRKESGLTVAEWHCKWTTDPLFLREKESTNIHYRERTRGFVAKYGSLPLERVDDRVVAEWISGGKNLSTVPMLRAMYNDAMSRKAGRLVKDNPFAGLQLEKSKGNALKDPPSLETVWALVYAARKLTTPGFAAWLQVAAFTGMRPGELDALRWDRVDFDRGRIVVAEQYSPKSKSFTLPKNGLKREAMLTPVAREALLSLARESEFCFTNLRGDHWTQSSRQYHWKAVRAHAGFEETLYLATRHFAGWYMTNELLLPSEVVGDALGHTDGGELVRSLYGHRDRGVSLDRALEAYERVGNIRPLVAVEATA